MERRTVHLLRAGLHLPRVGQRAVLGAHRPSGPAGRAQRLQPHHGAQRGEPGSAREAGFYAHGRSEGGRATSSAPGTMWRGCAWPSATSQRLPNPACRFPPWIPIRWPRCSPLLRTRWRGWGSGAACRRDSAEADAMATPQPVGVGKRREPMTVLGRLCRDHGRADTPLYWLAKDEATEGGERSWIRRWSRHGLCWRAVSATTRSVRGRRQWSRRSFPVAMCWQSCPPVPASRCATRCRPSSWRAWRSS